MHRTINHAGFSPLTNQEFMEVWLYCGSNAPIAYKGKINKKSWDEYSNRLMALMRLQGELS